MAQKIPEIAYVDDSTIKLHPSGEIYVDGTYAVPPLTSAAVKQGTDTSNGSVSPAILRDAGMGFNELSGIASDQDSNGVFTVLTYKRADSTNARISTLSGGTSPEYTTRTVVYYDADGSTPVATYTYALTYNGDGDLVSEVLT